LLSGLPLTSSVQNVYSNPSTISQVAGLGTAAYALNKMKKGGAVKSQGAGLADLALAKMA
jgi:homoserine dehydrogenase